MLRNVRPAFNRFVRFYTSQKDGEGYADNSTQPVLRKKGAKRVEVNALLNGVKEKTQVNYSRGNINFSTLGRLIDKFGRSYGHFWSSRRASI